MDRTISGIPCVQLPCSQVSELHNIFKGFITYLYSVILSCILFTRHVHTLRSVSNSFLISLLTNDCWSFCVFLYSLYTSTNKLTSSAWTGTWWIKLNFNPSHFAWTHLMTYSKENLENSGNKVPPCFRTFLIGNVPNIYLNERYNMFHIISLT